MRRRFLTGCFLAVVLTACGAATPTVTPTRAPTIAPTAASPTQPVAAPAITPVAARTSDWLFVRDDGGTPGGRLSVIDAGSGTKLRTLPLGVATQDWSMLYATEWGLDRTTVRALDPRTGQTVRETSVTGRYTLPEAGVGAALGGLSPNGRWLALGGQPSVEVGDNNVTRERSHLAVLDTAFAQQPKRIELDGNFTFDALSNDGASLYLIETLPHESTATPGLGYKVRLYDLNTSTLQPGVVVDKTAIAETMSGTRQSSIASPDGQWVYSLYLNEAKGPFIHMLNLSGRYAICVFLPTTGKEDVQKQLLWSIAQTRDGTRLYAVNGALGIVSEVDPAQLSVRRTVTLPITTASQPRVVARIGNWLMPSVSAKRFLTGGAALSQDGTMLFIVAENGLLAVNTSDLTPRGRYLPDLPLDSVTISPDGDRLYAVSAEMGKVLSLNAATGAKMTELTIASHQPWIILSVQ
jgi:hypothetical protein